MLESVIASPIAVVVVKPVAPDCVLGYIKSFSDTKPLELLNVVSGPWTGLEAEVISIKNSKIIAQLKIFGRETQVELTKDQVLKAK